MNKAELVKAMVNECENKIAQANAEDLLNTFLNIVKREVAAGNQVQLMGFGTFTTYERAERNGKNPQTGEDMTIPACVIPKFKPGKTFKDAVKK